MRHKFNDFATHEPCSQPQKANETRSVTGSRGNVRSNQSINPQKNFKSELNRGRVLKS